MAGIAKFRYTGRFLNSATLEEVRECEAYILFYVQQVQEVPPATASATHFSFDMLRLVRSTFKHGDTTPIDEVVDHHALMHISLPIYNDIDGDKHPVSEAYNYLYRCDGRYLSTL